MVVEGVMGGAVAEEPVAAEEYGVAGGVIGLAIVQGPLDALATIVRRPLDALAPQDAQAAFFGKGDT